ncbi:efflux RND transporter permease subunit [Aurantiacibacter flavus]|uniref:Efflux RND transporter permease subunit n=1 Tax=Aurantiacibacter flavus TaxID=3145232 RepID=A0ABV0CZZ9_9SPHN
MSIEAILRHNILLAVGVLGLCVLGLVAVFSVPVQMIPDVATRTVMVETSWPGATPQDVEKEILIEQERYLRTLPNLQRIISTASTGQASIQLDFPFGSDVNEALLRTSNALSQVRSYPENVDQPALTTTSSSEEPFMYFAITPHDGTDIDLNLAMVRDFLDDEVRPRLERIPGVSLVGIMGGAERQVRIEIDPERLAQRGLDMSDVREALRARNVDTSAGDIDNGKRRVLVRTVGRFDEAEGIASLIVSERNGTITRLSDLADIRLDHYEQREVNFVNGEAALFLNVRREAGANVVQTKYAVLPEIEAIGREVLAPAGLDIRLFSEDARYVERSVASVWRALGLGALLAAVVLYLFLRSARTTAIGVIAIPLCTIAAFAGLLLAGRTLNVISLAGIAFALGMTVDNAVVVLESIDQERRRGLKPFAAAVEGVHRVWRAVLACTVTTIIVFLPILFVEDEAGQLFSDIVIAFAASIIASLIVAVTVVPALAARLPDAASEGQTEGERYFDRVARRLNRLIESRMRRLFVIGGTVVGSLLTFLLLTPPAEYLPEGEEARIFANMAAPPGYSLSEMEGVATDLSADLRTHVSGGEAYDPQGAADFPDIQMFSMFVGPQSITVVTDPSDASQLEPLREALEERMTAFPGMHVSTARGSVISAEDGGTRSINVEISGNDLQQIYSVASRAFGRVEELFPDAQISSDPGSLTLDQPLLELHPRWDRIAEAGFDADSFGYSVAALSDGAYADRMILDDRQVDIYLYGSAGRAPRLEDLPHLPVATPSGAVLPVSALADLRETVDTDSIRRVNGRRTVTLYIVPPRSVALETGVEQVRSQILDEMQRAGEVPDGVAMDITGASDQLDATRQSLLGNSLIALILSYLTLVATFRHWGHPLLVMTTVPLGAAGGMLGLVLLNGTGALFGLLGLARIDQPFDMITLLGFLVLLSAVVNNPILIVMETYHGLTEGLSPPDAVEHAVRTRLRPILMSTCTTVIGLLPLVVIPGAGTELYRGLGAVMLGGMIVSMIVTVTFLPCLLVTTIEVMPGLSRRARAISRRAQALVSRNVPWPRRGASGA